MAGSSGRPTRSQPDGCLACGHMEDFFRGNPFATGAFVRRAAVVGAGHQALRLGAQAVDVSQAAHRSVG